MRKVICLLVFVFSIGLLLLSMNQSLLNRIKQDRYFAHLNPPAATSHSWYYRLFIRSDRWRYGDLYGLSYLHPYKLPLEAFRKYPPNDIRKQTNRILYISGDSFLADKSLKGAFAGFDDVIFLDRRFPSRPFKPDSTKENYMVMEFAERNLNVFDLDKPGETGQLPDKLPTGFFERVNKALFNKDLSRNLELLLFDDKCFTIVKECKAMVNYILFGRTANEVAVSTDRKRLFLNITVDTSSIQSAFRPKSSGDIEKIDHNLDVAKRYYLSMGFKKVFLAVIPNAVSIYDSKRLPYNQLLQRVESSTDLPVISVYGTFKRDHRNLFYRSDAHWNPEGFEIWINATARALDQLK